jgi:hypothetical protein
MPKVLPFRCQPPALHDRAMDNLEFIRTTMEQAGAFTAVSGWGMVIVGVIAIGTALIAARQPTTDRWLHVWLAAGASALIIQLWAMLVKARRSGAPLLSGAGRKFVLAVSPPIFVGAVLTIVLYNAGIVDIIPGVWLLLYGAAVIAGGTFSIEIVPLLGLCFLLAGTFALITPLEWNDWILAIAFGGFHIIFGIPIARRYGG